MPLQKYWDGTQYVPILGGIDQGTADARYIQQSGGTMTGALTVLTPTVSGHAVTKGYVDTYSGARDVLVPASGYADGGYGLWATKVGESLVNIEAQFKVTTAFTSDGWSKTLATIPIGYRTSKVATLGPGFFVSASSPMPAGSGYPCGILPQGDGQLRWVIASGISIPINSSIYANVTYRIG